MNKNNTIYFTDGLSLMLLGITLILASIAWSLSDINESIKEQNIQLKHTQYIAQKDIKVADMRITGYLPTGNKTALGEDVVVGRTAAVSRGCIEFLGSKVYVLGYGVYFVNDLTNKRLDEEFGMCTLDIAVSSKEKAYEIGNNTGIVIRIDK